MSDSSAASAEASTESATSLHSAEIRAAPAASGFATAFLGLPDLGPRPWSRGRPFRLVGLIARVREDVLLEVDQVEYAGGLVAGRGVVELHAELVAGEFLEAVDRVV